MTKHLTINVSDLRHRLGERRTIDIDVVLPALEVIASRSVPDEPVVGTVVIESIERGVSVVGQVGSAWIAECRRCLDDVEGRSEVQIDEIFQVDAPDDADLIDLVGDSIDLLPLVRDAVLVGLPLAPLCRETCIGPDPDRYPAVTIDEIEAERAAEEPTPDPRWAALGELDLNE